MKVKLLVILALTLCTPLFMASFMAPMANAKKSVPQTTFLGIVRCASQFGLQPGQSGYNATIVAKYDVDYYNVTGKTGPDGPINMIDLVTLLLNYTGGK